MKAIKLQNFLPPDKESIWKKRKYYEVHLGNGARKKFTSERHALQYLSDTSRFLTFKLRECNLLYIEVFCLYRKSWFYFEHTGKNQAEAYRTENVMERHLQEINDAFKQVMRLSRTDSSGTWVFHAISSISGSIQDCLDLLSKSYRRRNAMSEMQDVETIFYRVKCLKEEVCNYDLPQNVKFIEKEGNTEKYILNAV